MADCTCSLAPPRSTMGMSAIFDDVQIILTSNVHDGIHIRHVGSQVDGDYRSSLWSDGSFNCLGVNAVSVRVNITRTGMAPAAIRAAAVAEKV